MLEAFETRLATVLGASLAAPFAGRVTVAPDAANGAGPLIQLAVGTVRRLEPELGAFRQEQPPGLPTLRRVARLEADVAIRVTPAGGGGGGRPQTVSGVDALLYLLDDLPFRSGTALVQPGDNGFLLQSLRVTGASLPDDAGVARVDLTVSGWFWPLGEAGAAGIEIGEVQVRQFTLPVILHAPRMLAGAGVGNLALEFARAGTLQVHADTVASVPFGQVRVSILSADGSPGAGILSGGVAGGPEAQMLDVGSGQVSFAYTPPFVPGLDILVLQAVRADGAAGMEIARFDLPTEPGP